MWPHCDCKWHKSNLHVRVPFFLPARGQMWMHRTHTQHTIWLMVYWWKIAKSQIVDCVKFFPFVGQSKASVKLSQSSLLFIRFFSPLPVHFVLCFILLAFIGYCFKWIWHVAQQLIVFPIAPQRTMQFSSCRSHESESQSSFGPHIFFPALCYAKITTFSNVSINFSSF